MYRIFLLQHFPDESAEGNPLARRQLISTRGPLFLEAGQLIAHSSSPIGNRGDPSVSGKFLPSCIEFLAMEITLVPSIYPIPKYPNTFFRFSPFKVP